MVRLRVEDASGNINECMVEITVQDKIAPEIECPDDITISCNFDFDINDLSIFGTVQTDPDAVEEHCIFDPGNPICNILSDLSASD